MLGLKVVLLQKIKAALVRVHDKDFEVFLTADQVQSRISELGTEISTSYEGKDLVLIAVLNGSFMFAADLMKKITIPCEISFVKVSSYEGMGSSGRVDELIGLNTNIENRHVLIVEDIVDTGITMNKIYSYLSGYNPSSLKIMSLLYKPDAFRGKHTPDLVGFSIPNRFVVGYGLDYNEKGRNLEAIYKLIEG